MAIRKRASDEYYLVSKDDPSLDECPPKIIRSYARSYDFSFVKDYIASLVEDKPTLFRCKPLPLRWQNRLDMLNADDMWLIFSECVTSIDNLLDEDGNPIAVKYDGEGMDRTISSIHRERGDIPAAVFFEIANAIVHKATTADGVPFGSAGMLQDWLQQRGYKRHAAKADSALLVEIAKE